MSLGKPKGRILPFAKLFQAVLIRKPKLFMLLPLNDQVTCELPTRAYSLYVDSEICCSLTLEVILKVSIINWTQGFRKYEKSTVFEQGYWQHQTSFLSLTQSSRGDPALLIAFCPQFLQAALSLDKAEALLAESHVSKDSVQWDCCQNDKKGMEFQSLAADRMADLVTEGL